MNSKFVAIAAFAAVGASALRSAPLESYTYEQWIKDFKPETNLTNISDLMHRKNTFKANLAKIRSHNAAASAGVHSWTMDVNQFADLTESEVVAKYTGYNRNEALAASPAQFRNPYTRPSTVDLLHLPKSVDWSKIGAVSAVKNQRSCGSCWAFAAATTLESHAHIHAGYDISKEISTQQMVSCTPNPRHCGGTGGCHGATAQLAFEYLASTTGVTSESSYPYVARDTPCEFPSPSMPVDFKIAGHRDLRTNDKAELLKTIAEQGPVSVAVAAGRFAMYGGGIFDGCSKTGDNVINHAVVAIGYNVEDPLNSYLIIRNSWGPTWGESGNIRVRLNGAEGNEKCSWNKSPQDGSACDGETDPVYVCGECGILSDSTIPLGVTLA